jgi:hypothetical protein
MKKVVLIAIVVLTGCASISQSARNQQAEDELTQKIAQLERQCEKKAVQDANSKIARIAAGGDTLAQLETTRAKTEGDRKIFACKAEAEREDAKIAQQEVSEYQRQAQEQRSRGALMATLTSSRIH